MLTWVEAVACGAGGGLIAEAVVMFGRIEAWRQARIQAREARVPVPSSAGYIDPFPDALAAVFRVLLGSAAGFVFHSEITGVFAAVAVGASAPALLAQVGKAATPAKALRAADGSSPQDASSPEEAS